MREYKATHEENFWSNWLREDERVKKEQQKPRRMKKKRVKRGKEKRRKKRTTWERSREDVRVLSLWWPFEIFGQGRDLESNEDLSWEDPFDDVEEWSGCEPDSCASVRLVPDVTDAPVSPSPVVTELCGASLHFSDWSLVEPQSFSFSKKLAHCCTVTQEEVRCEDSPVKAPPPQEEE